MALDRAKLRKRYLAANSLGKVLLKGKKEGKFIVESKYDTTIYKLIFHTIIIESQ